MLENAKWIYGKDISGCPEFVFRFDAGKEPVSAELSITACGVYSAKLGGKSVGDFVLAPGWTVYNKRQQVQTYDVSGLLSASNELVVTLGSGWYCGRIGSRGDSMKNKPLLIAELKIRYANGNTETFVTDENWSVRESRTRFADIYDGERYDGCFVSAEMPASVIDHPKDQLIPQQGEKITRQDILRPVRIFSTPNGERVVDFGQEITGVAEIDADAPRGTMIRLTCAEMLDRDGNFYNDNYRSAKSEMIYISSGEKETWSPSLTFYGFRYLRVEGFEPTADNIRAIVISSDLRRTGWLSCGSPELNRLFENVVWGQRGNFLDVPTDCPQRDERLGWTGDAQVFANTACYQFDVKRFFTKWLDDMKTNQHLNGGIPCVIPAVWNSDINTDCKSSAAWADAATVCPWQIYRHYGDKELLRSHFEMMKKRVMYIGEHTTTPNLWTGYETTGDGNSHYGDWLGLDAKEGSYVGATDCDLIASAFYYYSTLMTIKAGNALSEDVSEYEALAERICSAFREKYSDYPTQTACALAVYFGLAEDPRAVSDKLASMIHENGDRLTTGFVGTPYLLYALSENGHIDTAYTLLTQTKFPSWLYSVGKGATTIWEHWDGLREDGSFWSRDMNSFNHYAYGAVAGWVFEEAAGIIPLKPGFAKIRVAPKPDKRLGWLEAKLDTPHGRVESRWTYSGDDVRYIVTVPTDAEIIIDGRTINVSAGTYLF